MKLRIITYFFVSLLSLACSNSTSGGPSNGKTRSSSQGSDRNYKVDILFVLDTSPESQPLHSEIAAQVDTFFSRLVSLRLDYHVSAITMDENDGANLLGWPTVIDKSTWNLEAAFSYMVQPPTHATTVARGLDQVLSAFSLEALQNQTAKFLREDAQLFIIFVSAKDDFSETTLVSFTSKLNQLKGERRWGSHLLGATNSSCSPYVDHPLYEISLIKKGIIAFVPCDSIDLALARMRNSIVQEVSRVPLQTLPVADSIHVTVNGRSLAPSDLDGWLYDRVTNSIVFTGHAAPAADAIIKIDFLLD